MTDEHLRRTTIDPQRDPRLARLLAEEYGVTKSALAGRVQSIIEAVAKQSDETAPWWTTLATWSRALVPLGVAIAASVFCFLLRAPSATLTPNPARYPDSVGGVTIVEILASRATSQDVVAVLMPATADELLTAAVQR